MHLNDEKYELSPSGLCGPAGGSPPSAPPGATVCAIASSASTIPANAPKYEFSPCAPPSFPSAISFSSAMKKLLPSHSAGLARVPPQSA